ncbi:MAG TPA: hypothetical protein VE693_06245 [Gaiellaceae bacterium]|nr:hypothetical protein [Gaiellaceae bacterium]
MYGFRWERWSAMTGVLFVACFLLGLALISNTGDTTSGVQSFYADSGNRAKEVTAFFFLVAAGIAFLAFLGTLRTMLDRAESGPGTLSGLIFGAGTIATTLIIAGAAVSAAPAMLAGDQDFQLAPNTAEALNWAGYLLLVAGVMAASIVVLATSTAALRTSVLPAWVGWIGLVVAVVMLLSIYYFPMIIFAGWILLVSLLMIVSAWKTEPVHPARTSAMG